MSEAAEVPPRVDQPLIPPFLPRMIHRLALPIVLIWLGIVFVTNTISPQLEVVSKRQSVSQSPTDAVSFQSMMHVGSTFKEFSTDSSAMILLEGDKPLGPRRTTTTTRSSSDSSKTRNTFSTSRISGVIR